MMPIGFSFRGSMRRAGALLLLSLIALVVDGMPVRAADINVGPDRTYPTLAAGVAAAGAGDRILLDPGIYTDDTAVTAAPLTIEGLGAGATLRVTRPIANHKGIVVSNAALTVRNITFDGAQVTQADGNNGAGIRAQAGNLTIENCIFTNNQDGVLVNPIPGAVVTVTRSSFTGNGAGDGYSHAIYVNEVARFDVSDSTFSGTKVGHNIKSRALKTSVVRTTLEDGVTGTASYAVDLPNGGVAVLDRITVTQGLNSQNPVMVAYGAEGNLKATNSLAVTNSIFIDDMRTASVVAVANFTSLNTVILKNNVFQNVARVLRGLGDVQAMDADHPQQRSRG